MLIIFPVHLPWLNPNRFGSATVDLHQSSRIYAHRPPITLFHEVSATNFNRDLKPPSAEVGAGYFGTIVQFMDAPTSLVMSEWPDGVETNGLIGEAHDEDELRRL